MNLYTVTIAGADDNAKPKDLAFLSERYPFVEWGILLSQSKQGSNRYPSYNWIDSLEEFQDSLRLSGHLCGGWVRDIVNGQLSFRTQHYNIWSMLNRIQINLNKIEIPTPNKFLDTIAIINKQLILQVKSIDDPLFKSAVEAKINVSPLFDQSCGTGKCPDNWPKTNVTKCGFAGGLNPDNIEEQLDKISKIAANKIVWIDLESGVRTKDRFDIEKTDAVLNIVEDYISQDCSAASYLETPVAKKRIQESLNPPPII